jgi:hypothetical protein
VEGRRKSLRVGDGSRGASCARAVRQGSARPRHFFYASTSARLQYFAREKRRDKRCQWELEWCVHFKFLDTAMYIIDAKLVPKGKHYKPHNDVYLQKKYHCPQSEKPAVELSFARYQWVKQQSRDGRGRLGAWTSRPGLAAQPSQLFH